jgi:hypothetical protein
VSQAKQFLYFSLYIHFRCIFSSICFKWKMLTYWFLESAGEFVKMLDFGPRSRSIKWKSLWVRT